MIAHLYKALPYNYGMETAQGIRVLGRLLRKARLDKGWVQKDVADRTGLSVGYISNTEQGYINPKRGPVVPSDDTLRALSEALEVPVSEMHAALGRAATIEVELDPDLQMIVENWEGMTPTGKRHMKSAAELALEMSREGSIGKRAE